MSIDIANESGVAVDEVGLAAVARFTLDQMRIHPLAELSVLLVDERTMTELHERWMGEPGPTDVLAFPMDELRPPHLGGNRAGDPEPGDEPGLLGDVVLCPQVATEQAQKAGHSAQDELELLTVHGILHLLGYDHAEPEEHAAMFGTQDQLLNAWRADKDGDKDEGARRDRVMSPPGWLLVAAAVLALAAGWCANAEAALTLVTATGVAERPEHKGPLQAVAKDLPRYMSVLLLLRAILECLAAVLVTAAFVHWLSDDWRAVLAAAGVVILMHYALTGVRPQLGRVGPRTERTAGRAARFLYPLTRALGPLPRLLVAVGNTLPPRRPMPADGSESGDESGGPVARSELRGLVDYLERRTGIEPGEREMVRSVFELGDTIAREVMVPRTDMVFIESDKTVEQALSLALRSGFSRIPVVGENEDDVVGIAYLKDIVAWSHEHPGAEATEKVATVMRPASYVPDSKPVDELLRQMQAQRNHMVIVIDEYGGTAGLVTIEDLLEEIVGEITDEYDNEQPPVTWLSADSARVTARLAVPELEELFSVHIDAAEDVETVAGLLAHALGRVPIAGSTAVVNGLRLTAEPGSGRRNKIGTVLVQRESDE